MLQQKPLLLTDKREVDSKIDKVFVYGTLLRGGPNHYEYLRDCTLLRHANIPAMMLGFPNFPGVILHRDIPNDHPAKAFIEERITSGQVFKINPDDGTLECLDMLEQAPNFYRREVIEIKGVGSVYVYVLQFDKYVKGHQCVVASGVWLGDKTTVSEVNFYEGDRKPMVLNWFNRDRLIGAATQYPPVPKSSPVIYTPPYPYSYGKRDDDEWEEVEVEIDTLGTEVDMTVNQEVREA